MAQFPVVPHSVLFHELRLRIVTTTNCVCFRRSRLCHPDGAKLVNRVSRMIRFETNYLRHLSH
jgi:hypothetical protein